MTSQLAWLNRLLAPRSDLGVTHWPTVDWSPQQSGAAIQQIFDYAKGLSEEAIDWYIKAKNKKRRLARGIRVAAIILGGVGGLLPTISELGLSSGLAKGNGIPAGWMTVLLGIVGILLLFDRFFGYSSGWMRYISTELQLRQIAQEFQLDWEVEKASWQGSQPTKEQAIAMLARCKAFVTQVNTLVREETNVWIQEFESAIRQIDETVKARTASVEPGALNLTVTNGESTINGWKLSLDDGAPESYSGKTAGKRNLVPGRHQVKVDGEIAGKHVQAEKIVTVLPGGTCDETLTLA